MSNGVRLSEIKENFSGLHLIIAQLGVDVGITGINTVASCEPGDLVFVSNRDYLELARQRNPAALVVPEHLAEDAAEEEGWGILVTGNVKLAHALIKQKYGDRDFLDGQWGRVHSSAVIHRTAKIPDSCFIGPGVVIGENTRLGDNCRLLAGVVIENDVEIGNDCVFHPNCVIGYHCKIGNEVEIGAGTVVGSEGYGFAQDQNGRSYKIPQTGHVVIEDRVLLGACNTIDRATYGQTRIGAGTKTDNIIHIAHNVEIGQDCMLTAMFVVAGSSKIGDRCITSGQVEVSDHINIGNDVVLVHRAGVTRNIAEPGMYAGLPTQPLNQYMKNTAHFRKLDALNRKVVALEKAIKNLNNQ